jgi:hypothetical protein
MNKEGKVPNSCVKLYNNREGFEHFVKMTEGLKVKYGLKNMLIGMERPQAYRLADVRLLKYFPLNSIRLLSE